MLIDLSDERQNDVLDALRAAAAASHAPGCPIWQGSQCNCYVQKASDALAILQGADEDAAPTPDDMNQIVTFLREEYSWEEVNAMLKAATIRKDLAGVTVTYDNGLVDRFVYVGALAHCPAPTD
jgi:hypothetical protein